MTRGVIGPRPQAMKIFTCSGDVGRHETTLKIGQRFFDRQRISKYRSHEALRALSRVSGSSSRSAVSAPTTETVRPTLQAGAC
jgi:hypothetical protein